MHTKRFCTVETCSMCAKTYQRGLQAPTTWPTSHDNISGKLRVRNCQSIKFFKFFKIKSSTNQIRAVIARSYVYDLTCVKVSHLFQWETRLANLIKIFSVFGIQKFIYSIFKISKPENFFFMA